MLFSLAMLLMVVGVSLIWIATDIYVAGWRRMLMLAAAALFIVAGIVVLLFSIADLLEVPGGQQAEGNFRREPPPAPGPCATLISE